MKNISGKIQSAYEDSVREPTTENIKKLKEMHDLADLISKLPVWPFDVKSLLSVLATIIIPIIIMFLQTLVKFLFGWKG